MMLEDATAADNCNGASIELITETVEGDATGNYTLLRTFTATDDAGNSASVTQTIAVQDTTAPEFTFVPGNYTAECSDELAMDMATAVDNCDGVEMEVSAETISGDAAGNYTIVRTFWPPTMLATAMWQHNVTVQDTTAPD